ncbi:Periplasmic divalent cation tolerance protein CutA [hydrothermal vent metagenome]|uniref:Periplasmic divalent cation tolerance protein CutA n=1 Tax=hydrothermal vent metagenome TaxID=652676 RepID=A0A3B0V1C7_9ZZZZ
MSDGKYIVVFMTAPGGDEAARIGRAVVLEGLAACCNIVPKLRSIYRWQGELCDEQEALCILKTRSELFEVLKDRLVELHSYEVPEVIAIDIEDGSAQYLKWIDEVTG